LLRTGEGVLQTHRSVPACAAALHLNVRVAGRLEPAAAEAKRGPLTERKHKGGENSSTAVTLADIAGANEAKEELPDIVVSPCPCCIFCGYILSPDDSLTFCVDLRMDLCWLLCKP
jgi:hypothetical protein